MEHMEEGMNNRGNSRFSVCLFGLCLILVPELVSGEDVKNAGEDTGARIVAVAESQIGRHDRDAGWIGLYHGHGSAWCSEFVSWCYMTAGVPFSGGRKNIDLCFKAWNLTNTRQIIRYFKKHLRYYEIDDLPQDLIPRPGDYVFITNTEGRRAHSGIAKEVIQEADGTETLVTIEGNNKGRPVAEYRYPDFRHNKVGEGIVGGIGVR
jgi:hypothetical protein